MEWSEQSVKCECVRRESEGCCWDACRQCAELLNSTAGQALHETGCLRPGCSQLLHHSGCNGSQPAGWVIQAVTCSLS
jgi:hypothetical protein